MKKRWQFDSAFFGPLAFIWFLLGAIAVAITHHGPHHDINYIALAIWLGPFVLIGAGGLIGLTVLELWEHRPRRIEVPLPDLREHDITELIAERRPH